MAEESDEALEISSNEESGTDRDDTKKKHGSINFRVTTIWFTHCHFLAGSPKISNSCRLSRKRHLRQNPPPKGVKTGKVKEKGDPKQISACERLKSYPNEEFIVRSSKLFCRACKEALV